MKITIAKSSGFCFGVRRAIDICNRLASTKKKAYVLGDIVHNSFVVEELKAKGIKKISRVKPSKNSTLIIRAHGAPESTFKKARKCGYRIVDATCPKVRDIYRIAKKLEKDNTVIIIGDTGHDEVKGIAGQLKKTPFIVESPGDVSRSVFQSVKKAAVITQSTQSLDNITSVMRKLEKIIPDVKLYNTTCRTTVIKQEEIQSLPRKNDLILIIGSMTSANTKRLFNISRTINRKTYWIESAKGLKPSWVRHADKIGIMAGASTPDYITQQVVACIKKMKPSERSKKNA
ncbi:MAG: 4-hydroxy-3-methylbut-2-enyl diphosphate reductase [Candidatus Omnitrophota bacterium]